MEEPHAMSRSWKINSLAGVALLLVVMQAPASAQAVMLAAAPQEQQDKPEQKNITPEQKMNSRFPQPVRVGDLIGLPVLDQRDSTLGYIQKVVRTSAGKIVLVVNYRAWLAWAPIDWGRRDVGVPLETVAILARQVAALDFSRDEFAAAPTFSADQGTPLGMGDMIKIAITRR
jgi:hypothetical protein